jgi:ABC-2 type transport system permease protein
MVITKGVFLKDASAAFVLENTLPLVVIAAFTLSAAVLIFRRRFG